MHNQIYKDMEVNEIGQNSRGERKKEKVRIQMKGGGGSMDSSLL